MWTRSWLQAHRCLPHDAVVIAFDWPSQRVYRNDVLDVTEKGRRAYIAAYHLARFVQSFPPSSRVCLLGHSYGGRVVPGALHLLGGGALNSQSHDPEVCLPTTRPDLDMRGIIIAGASDRDWLDPGRRFDRTLAGADEVPEPLQPQGRGADLLPRPAQEQPPPGHRPDRPDQPRLRPARPAGAPLRGARRPRPARRRAHAARRRGQPADRPLDRPPTSGPPTPARSTNRPSRAPPPTAAAATPTPEAVRDVGPERAARRVIRAATLGVLRFRAAADPIRPATSVVT